MQLTIKDVQDTDAGVYVCTASNALGSGVTSAALRVSSGQGNVISSTQHPAGSQGLESIASVEAKMVAAGKISLGEGSEADEIRDKPQFTTTLKEKLLVGSEETEINLECVVEPKKDPTLKVSWFHNGLPVEAGARVKFGLDFGVVSLTIADVRASDAGVYTCRARNAVGQAATFSAVEFSSVDTGGLDLETKHPRGSEGLKAVTDAETKVEIELPGQEETPMEATEAPRFLQEFTDQVVAEGKTAYCEAVLLPKNDPTMQIEWTLNGEPLGESKKLPRDCFSCSHNTFFCCTIGTRLRTVNLFGLVILEKSSLKESEFGNYKCIATNAAGSCQSSFNLIMGEARADLTPRFTSLLKVILNTT